MRNLLGIVLLPFAQFLYLMNQIESMKSYLEDEPEVEEELPPNVIRIK